MKEVGLIVMLTQKKNAKEEPTILPPYFLTLTPNANIMTFLHFQILLSQLGRRGKRK